MNNLGQFFLNNLWGVLFWSLVGNAIFAFVLWLFRNVKSFPVFTIDKRYGSKSFLGLRIYKRLRWRTAEKSAINLANQIRQDEWSPDLIVGIGRGGAIYGAMLSYKLAKKDRRGKKKNIPLAILERQYRIENNQRKSKVVGDIECFLTDKEGNLIAPEKVLLVAGEGHTGDTMNMAKELVNKKYPEAETKSCVFYQELPLNSHFDYSGVTGKGFNSMPWQDEYTLRESYMDKCIIYIVRHCETKLNGEDRFVGSTDDEEAMLNKKGISQAKKLAEFFKDKNIIRIYSSPLKRCLQTANAIKGDSNLFIEVEDDLREMDYGKWEKMKREDIEKQYNQEYKDYIDKPNFTLPGSKESPGKVEKRIIRFLKTIAKFHESQKPNPTAIVVVTHKTVGRIMINYILKKQKMGKKHYRDIKMENGSVTTVLFDNDQFYIQ